MNEDSFKSQAKDSSSSESQALNTQLGISLSS